MKDLSGHGNHGTIAGASDVLGIIGRARQFNGTDYIEAPDSSDLDVFTGITIAAWVYLQADHTGGSPTMIRKQGSFLLELGDNGTNRPSFFLWWSDGSAGPLLSGPPVAKLEWHHWAATYDGIQMRLYLDGAVVGSLPISKTVATSPDPLRMGHWATEWFKGILDEVRVFSRALNGTEIAALVSTAPAHPPGPRLFYDMQNLTLDGRMKDLSGHGNHGTMTGTTDVAGKVGRARQFNGIVDYIEAPDSLDLHVSSGITIAVWVYLQADHADGTATMIRKQGSFLLELGDNGTNRPTFFLWWSDGSVGPILSGPPVAKYEWHHLAATYNGTSMRLYFDGALVNSFQISKTIATSPDPLRLGHWATEWFAGILDEFRIFARALTDAEIANLVSPPSRLYAHSLGTPAFGNMSTMYAASDAPGNPWPVIPGGTQMKTHNERQAVGSVAPARTLGTSSHSLRTGSWATNRSKASLLKSASTATHFAREEIAALVSASPGAFPQEAQRSIVEFSPTKSHWRLGDWCQRPGS
jgi:hypothetical protein